MAMRRDAGAAALLFGARLTEAFRKTGSPDSVWNIGNVTFEPGAENVVPGEVRLALQFRDGSTAVLERLEETAARLLDEAGGAFAVTHEFIPTMKFPPTPMHAALTAIVEKAAQQSGAPHIRMPSGAGHDAMTMARYLPAAMFFVPSIG